MSQWTTIIGASQNWRKNIHNVYSADAYIFGSLLVVRKEQNIGNDYNNSLQKRTHVSYVHKALEINGVVDSLTIYGTG